tara:strand:- start:2394 stop:3080 length:687 start_codon:yes stop_codon:yes gene_type:complete
MITLPKFTSQNMYDAETHYNLFMNEERFSKLLIHYEIFKKIKKMNGAIVECGVFKGTSFSRFAMLRELIGNPKKNKLIAFDVFNDNFPNTKHVNEKKQRAHWLKTAGGSSIATSQLNKIFKKKKIENYELVKGDVLKTIPEYLKINSDLKISLLNIDIDFVETTECVLENFYPRVSKGGIIIFDNYEGIGTGGTFYQGETNTINKFLKKVKKKLIKFPFCNRPSYIIK